MTNKLILINTDTHVVVPRELDGNMYDELYDLRDRKDISASELYKRLIEAAPQLTTPPVLRWEGEKLIIGNVSIAWAYKTILGIWAWNIIGDFRWTSVESQEQARRAAEKALGFPDDLIIEVL